MEIIKKLDGKYYLLSDFEHVYELRPTNFQVIPVELFLVEVECPCGAKGFKRGVGTRASGEHFFGCDFCLGKF